MQDNLQNKINEQKQYAKTRSNKTCANDDVSLLKIKLSNEEIIPHRGGIPGLPGNQNCVSDHRFEGSWNKGTKLREIILGN